MGLLDGGLAKIIGQTFSSGYQKFLPAIRYRSNDVLGDGGDYTKSAPTPKKCMAFVEAGENMRRNPEYTDVDAVLYVLGASLNNRQATLADLTTDDTVIVNGGAFKGQLWAIQKVALDAAGAVFTCGVSRA